MDKQKVLVGAALAVVSGVSMAALPTAATDAFTAVQGNVTDILAAIWPIVAMATGGFILIRLFKKGANSAI